MEFFIVLLNLPQTLIGLIFVVLSGPYHIKITTHPFAVVFKVKSFWWGFHYYKNARAMTMGHLILMSPKELKNDYEHEIVHVKQTERYPFIFPFLYFYQTLKHGYRMNCFEDEAFVKSKSYHKGIQQGI